MRRALLMTSVITVAALICAVGATVIPTSDPLQTYQNRNTATIVPSVWIEYDNGTVLTNSTIINWGNLSVPNSYYIGAYSFEKWLTIVNKGSSSVGLALNVSGLPNGWQESLFLFAVSNSTQPGQTYQLNPNSSAEFGLTLWIPEGYAAGTYNWTSEISILAAPSPNTEANP